MWIFRSNNGTEEGNFDLKLSVELCTSVTYRMIRGICAAFLRTSILLLLGATPVFGKYNKRDTWERNAVIGCAFQLSSKVPWDYQNDACTEFYCSVCSYDAAFGSLAVCVYDSLNSMGNNEGNKTFDKSWVHVQNMCIKFNDDFGNLSLDYYHEQLDLSYTIVRQNYSLENSPKVDFPVELNPEITLNLVNAYHKYFHNMDDSNFFVYFYYIYLFLIFFLASIGNYLTHINKELSIRKYTQWYRMQAYFTKCLWKGYHTSYYNFMGKFFIGLFPSKLETSIVTNYAVLNGILLAICYKYDSTNSLFSSKTQQVLRLLADRSGILAFGNLPIIFLFGTRNNILMWLTGFSLSTFIALHKWIGRIMIINSLIHSVSYLAYSILTGSFDFWNMELYYKCGIAAIFLLIIMFFLSLGYMRNHYYEIFLYTHIALAIGFMMACWKHVENLGWKNWLIISVSLWIFERFARIVCLLLNGGPLSSRLQLFENHQNTDDILIRVTIKKGKTTMTPKPGQFFFVYFMHPMIFWQSHPFTVIEEGDGDSIIIVLKPKHGASRVLYNSLVKAGGTLDMKLALEGPYGHSAPIKHADHVVLLAAGTGIPGPLYHAMSASLPLSDSPTNSIDLNIIVRNINILNAFRKELFYLHDRNVNIKIFLTRYKANKRANSIATERSSLVSKHFDIDQLKSLAKVYFTRPDLRSILKENIEPHMKTAIVTCGAPEFVDALRDIISTEISSNPSSLIDYYEEFQRW